MFSRRDFGKSLGTACATAALARPGVATALERKDLSFPEGFRWGCATAAYQIEGAVKEDGRGPTNWDVFSHTPGKVFGGHTGDVADDSYHRYAEDTQLLKNLGVHTYRMSLAWSRIFPEGRGHPNPKGVDQYNRVVDNLLENGIEPYITMFHWDLPAALPGGWQNRDTAYAFADYAGYMAGKLSDRVRNIMTVNELRCFTDLGHKQGIHAPGLKLPDAAANQVRHHGTLAHGLGVQAIRARAKADTKVGIADNTTFYVPVIDTPEWARADDSPKGYATIPHIASSPHMASPWLIVGPEVAYWGIRQVSELWKPSVLYISENGASADDPVQNGRIDDADRVMYLRNYLSQLQRATAEGYPLKGYFLWSLMDNFEWADGYSKRFGIHYVDFQTQKRIPKLSAAWYKEVIARNAVV